MKVAGIDVHEKVLMVVVMDISAAEQKPAGRRFVILASELQRFRKVVTRAGSGQTDVMSALARELKSTDHSQGESARGRYRPTRSKSLRLNILPLSD